MFFLVFCHKGVGGGRHPRWGLAEGFSLLEEIYRGVHKIQILVRENLKISWIFVKLWSLHVGLPGFFGGHEKPIINQEKKQNKHDCSIVVATLCYVFATRCYVLRSFYYAFATKTKHETN